MLERDLIALNAANANVARNVRANNYTSASMVCTTLDGIFVTRRGFCTLCLIVRVHYVNVFFLFFFLWLQ